MGVRNGRTELPGWGDGPEEVSSCRIRDLKWASKDKHTVSE